MTTEDLSRMGSAKVSIETLNGVDCILKQNASQIEVDFYRTVAPNLVGMNTPELLKLDGCNLYIERIPNTVTLNELRSRVDLYAQLANLHRSKYIPEVPVKNLTWALSDTIEALNTLALSGEMASSIKRMQSLSGRILEHKTLISGDTNDGNWGVRNNGELVLFDWERFSQGSPAIDLAPLVHGLGSINEYERIVSQYVKYNSEVSEEELIENLIIAKCWIIIEVVNILVRRNNPDKEKYLNWYRANIPKWLASVESAL